MDYKIEITADQPRGVMTALSAAITISKALNFDSLSVDCGGINIIVSKDSRVVDVFKIYEQAVKIRELENPIQHGKRK